MRTLLAAALVASLVAAPASAAMLRPLTTLGGAVVRLSDLFDDAGPRAHLALGPSPAPGESITVEAPQLAAIAREFGVAWRPASDADRAVLQRPGVPLAREAVIACLRTALDNAGAGDGEVDLPGFAAPLVAPEAHAQAAVEQLSFDAGSGRFTASVAVTGSDMAPLHLRVSGQLVAMETLLVATHRLAAGVELQPGDLRPARVRSAGLSGELVRRASQVVGLAPRRPVMEGDPLILANLHQPLVVQRGARVSITLDSSGLSLSATGEALEAGAAGERITVLNPVSHAVLLAEIVGPDSVRLEPGSMPLRPGTDSPRPGGTSGIAVQ